jgi:hypothetical protein
MVQSDLEARTQSMNPTFFVLCVFANLEASQFSPWKREALENCFLDAICNK